MRFADSITIVVLRALALTFAIALIFGNRARAAVNPPATQPHETWATPRVAHVIHEAAIFRVGPGEDYDRRTPLSDGALLQVKGRTGTWLMVELGGGDRGWVEEKDVSWAPDGTAITNTLRNVLVRANGDETFVDLQMTQRVSYDVTETLDPPALVVRLHQTTAMMNEIAQYAGDSVLGASTVRQVAAGVVELHLPVLGRGCWGWRASYGASPNLPSDPPGHDFRLVAAENLRLAVRWPPRRAATTSLDGITVAIDPGHGGPDSGAVGVGGLKEKDINLSVAMAVREALQARGAHVIMTRESDRAVAATVDRELSARVDMAQAAHANLFISIHHNARARIEDARVAHGVFVYYYQPHSADLARNLMDPVADAQSERVRAYVFRSFHVIRQPYMPAVLIEVGFISNADEERKMRAADYSRRVADGIVRGVERFLQERLQKNESH